MKILVTGGTGSVGQETVRELVQLGHEVRVIGRRADQAVSGAAYRPCDITDFTALKEQMRDIESVIHLAAIPHPGMGTGQEIFRINCSGTFNVYQAAAETGIKRVVTASSINAFGYNFGVKDFDIQYLPIDESHPTCTSDPYSFSKHVTEDIADYFWRREGISGVCLRLPAVINLSSGHSDWRTGARTETLALFAELHQHPEAGHERVERVRQQLHQIRMERTHEQGSWRNRQVPPDMLIITGWTNFWTGLDTRDTAQALIKGIFACYEGSHPLFVNDSRNVVGVPSFELAATFFPQVSAYKIPFAGQEALVSIERAHKLLGFEPEYHLADL
ncbi:MAG: NAD(P)-dependent oxidoreductase [Chloroflexi bacterium]|nr:NAD(P)-dependent oxidoreductase [Chloroflexota bacterium]